MMNFTDEPIDTANISLDESRIRSSRLPSLNAGDQISVGSDLGPVPATAAIPGLNAIVEVLQSSGLPGPAILTGPKNYLGQGAQFIVYQGEMISSGVGYSKSAFVAIKQPKFDLESSDHKLSLISPDTQPHLKSVALEVKALATLSLRNILMSYNFSRGPSSPTASTNISY